MTARPLPSLAFTVLAFVALAHNQAIDFAGRQLGHVAYWSYETAALLADHAPPRPVDLPQRLVAAPAAPADRNRRAGPGTGVFVVTLAWLAAQAWTTPGLFWNP